jgi:cytochrome c oxidase assembly factor CtaG
MNVRTKSRLLIVAHTVGPFVLFMLSILVSMNFVPVLLVVLVGCPIGILMLRCPRCEQPVHEGKGFSIWLFQDEVWSPSNCRKCGYPLDY